jgi:hypothetical protein
LTEGYGTALSARGTPGYWHAPAGVGPPSLRLVALAQEQTRRAWLGSVLLLVGLGLAWALQYTPRVLGWVQALWPEQLVGLGLFVYLLDGRLPAAAALVLLGAVARSFYLLRAAAALWPRHAPQTAPATPGSAGSAT